LINLTDTRNVVPINLKVGFSLDLPLWKNRTFSHVSIHAKPALGKVWAIA